MSQSKEVHFFDHHFDRGLDWYRQFFPASPRQRQTSILPPDAIGEFTPHYLYEPACPKRIAASTATDRFILCLRDPVDRAVSHWHFRRQLDNYSGSFEQFLEDYPHAVDWGRYATHLRPWLDDYRVDQFLVLVFEDMFADVEATARRVANFVGVDPSAFPPEAGRRRVNASYVPRHRRLYAFARRRAKFFRQRDMQRALAVAKRLKLESLLGGRTTRTSAPVPPVSDDTRARLSDTFTADVEGVQAIFGLDLSHWKSMSR